MGCSTVFETFFLPTLTFLDDFQGDLIVGVVGERSLIHRRAERDRIAGESRLADRLVLLVELLVEHHGFAHDRRWVEVRGAAEVAEG